MSHFSLIVPCGIREHGVATMAQLLGRTVGVAEVKARVRTAFERVFEVTLEDVELDRLEEER